MSDDSEMHYSDHPRLRTFNRTAFMVRHVVKTTLKWAAIGAIALLGAALAIAVVPMLANPVTTFLIGLGGHMLGLTSTAVGFSTTAALYTAATGGILGAAVGGIVAITGASEAADAEEDRLVDKFDKAQDRRDRVAALYKQRSLQEDAMNRQAMAMGNPNMQIPMTRTASHAAGRADEQGISQ